MTVRIADSSSRNAVTFHPRAQRNAFRRRDVRLQRKSFALRHSRLRRSPNSNRPCGAPVLQKIRSGQFAREFIREMKTPRTRYVQLLRDAEKTFH
jgi:hypothetical protein